MRRLAPIALAVLAALAGPALGQFEVLPPPPAAAPSAASDDTTPVKAALPACGADPFTIAEMGWPSAAILAHIHAAILRTEFGCSVRLVPGEPESTLSSIATTRQPAVAPELWVSRQAEVWNGAMRASSARAAAPTFSGGPLEAWFVPRYVIANNPGLAASADLVDHWRVFAPPGGERARLLSCPADWACAVMTANLAGALGLTGRFDIVTPLDRFDLDGRIGEAVARREPVLAYYWQPNALVETLDLVPLDMGAVDTTSVQCMGISGCIPFEPSGFPPDTVVIAVAEWVFAQAPDVADYFARASMPVEEMNRLLAWQAEQEAAPDAVAQHFLISGRDIWRQWVGTAPEAEPGPDAE
ncbi:glycine betaine ABC transporter substrate-binding protein [Pelagibacterium lacus]|uniref:ABC-type glycine betaine transport system substrate-binding domain-containing protein n=1 Tax=Pelagibacterium lacus TaxID=2282655 RepID=A0A369W238_9HYPH|nr:glycine betaine ABC transporter substrate-binding protein [Pelagibacterium lacus]RDE08089.1 hypothetical protein DVH29_13465 [Pelagibacterium lacus]